MRAVSDDLLHWEKCGEFFLPAPEGYDGNDWRDPYILWDEGSEEYIMILGARKLEGKKVRTGCTVWYTSKDLEHWEFQGDFWAPNLYSMHEMPDLFRIGDWWYLLTTEYSEKMCIRDSLGIPDSADTMLHIHFIAAEPHHDHHNQHAEQADHGQSNLQIHNGVDVYKRQALWSLRTHRLSVLFLELQTC